MAVNLKELHEAANRYDDHRRAMENVDPESKADDQRQAAQRFRNFFLPASERLLAVRSQATAELRREMNAGEAFAPETRSTSELPESDARLLTLEGGVLPEIAQRDNDLRPMRFLQLALLAGRAVGRIQISDSPLTEEGDATGFLVAPGVLITNWHVLKTADFAMVASVVFDDEDELNGEPRETKIFRLRPDLLFVNDRELDYAVVAVASRTSSGVPLSQFGYLRLFEQTGKLDPTQRQAANIIQHPGGGRKKIAFRDNYIDEVIPNSADPAKRLNSLFYGTDTLRGSSGSPVCSDQWYVVALHRGGVPATERNANGELVVLRLDGMPARESDSRDLIRYVTNEGTRVSRIYFSLREKANVDTDAAVALQKISAVATDPRHGPLNLPTAPIFLPALAGLQEGGAEEIIHRKNQKFDGAKGYQPAFLGTKFRVGLPRMTSEVRLDLASLKDSTKTELKYDHYSLRINRQRRTAFYTAANINGKQLWGVQGLGALPKRPPWSYDPRMDEAFQPDDDIFSNALQRGHLFKREDAVWGIDKPAMQLSDEHSFTITNATPMIANFNNVEWGDLEDIVTRECEAGNKVSYFAGPIFRSTDPFYNELKKDVPVEERQQGMRVPESFWKIVFWKEGTTLNAAGFILHQKDEIAEHGPITEEINFGTYRQRPITEIEQSTGLRFPELVPADTFEE